MNCPDCGRRMACIQADDYYCIECKQYPVLFDLKAIDGTSGDCKVCKRHYKQLTRHVLAKHDDRIMPG